MYKKTNEEIEEMSEGVSDTIQWIMLILLTVISYNVLIHIAYGDKVDFNFIKADVYEEPLTFDEYVESNQYEYIEADFSTKSIRIDGVDRNFVKINDDTLKAYWDYHGYTPDNVETKKVYYNGSKIYTKYKLNKIYESTKYDNIVTKGEVWLIRVFTFLALFVLSVLIVGNEYSYDVIFSITSSYYKKRYNLSL